MFYIKGELQVKVLKIWKICLYLVRLLCCAPITLLHITSFNENEVNLHTKPFSVE